MRVTNVTSLGGDDYRMYFDSDNGNIACTFEVDDKIKLQRWTGSDVRLVQALVTSINNPSGYFDIKIYPTSDTPTSGDYVRYNNISNNNRKGALYLTSSDSDSPFIDVIYDQTTKVRLGNLSGINDPDLGSLDSYGLYSDNVYLKGKIIANSGEIGGWRINPSSIDTGSQYPNGEGIEIDKGARRIIVWRDTNNYINIKNSDSNNWGIEGKSGGDFVFRLGSTNEIAGWNFDNQKFYKTVGSDTAILQPSKLEIYGGSDSTTALFYNNRNGSSTGVLGFADSNSTSTSIGIRGDAAGSGLKYGGYFTNLTFAQGLVAGLTRNTSITFYELGENETVFSNAHSSANVTLYLPNTSAEGRIEGKIYYIYNYNGYNLFLNGNGKNIRYGTSTTSQLTISNGQRATVIYDGSEWLLFWGND
jgi:hypothetical protein